MKVSDDQLLLIVDRDGDLAWMRGQVNRRGTRDITERHLEHFYGLADHDRELALDALITVAAGRVHDGLRARLEARAGAGAHR